MQPPQVGDRFGRYRIDALLGMGGMGVVHLATDSQLNRQVALKVVAVSLVNDEHYLARFHREADVLTRLDSPHIVRIFDHGEEQGCAYLATQHVAGGDLARLTAQRGALPTGLAISLCAQVADGLADAHRSGVIHRDIKPSNVLIHDPDATQLHAYICDFGIAQTQDPELTGTRGVTGSWPYLAPERARGERGSAASDVYSLGCLLWFCLTGRTPYPGTDVETAVGHAHGPIPRLAGDSPATRQLNTVLARSMAKEPRERYATAEEMRDALRAAGAAAGVASRMLPAPPPPPATVQRPRRHRALTVGLAALVVLVAAGVGVVVARSVGGPTPDEETTSSPGPAPEPGSDAVTADYDGDGLGDVVVTYDVGFDPESAEQPPRALNVFRSDAEQFGEPEIPEDASDEARQLLRADLDDEPGDEVYVVGSRGVQDGFRLSQVDGDAPIDVAAVDGFMLSPVSGDFDSDGHDDLVVVAVDEQDTATFYFYANYGGAVFDLPQTPPKPWLKIRDWRLGDDLVVSGDFDGNARDDLVAVRRGDFLSEQASKVDSTVQLLSSTGSGFDVVGSPRGLGDKGNSEVHAGDFDADGADELVAIDTFYALPSQIRLVELAGDEFGTPDVWGQVQNEEEIGAELGGAPVGDFDGDGIDDVGAVYRSLDGTLLIDVYRSTGSKFEDAELWARHTPSGPVSNSVVANTEPSPD